MSAKLAELQPTDANIAWALRFVLRAGGPLLVEAVRKAAGDTEAVQALTQQVIAAQRGTSAAKDAWQANFDRMQREGEEERRRQKKAAEQRKRAEELVMAEELKEREKKIAAKVAEMEANAKK